MAAVPPLRAPSPSPRPPALPRCRSVPVAPPYPPPRPPRPSPPSLPPGAVREPAARPRCPVLSPSLPPSLPAAMLAASASLLRRCAVSGLRSAVRRPAGPAAVLPARCYSHGSQESDEEFDARWVTYFNKPDIDAWELRKGINTLVSYDLVPEPKIIDAALRACRRLNDFASAVRILEVVKDKAGPHKEIYPYVIQELRPTLSELGISTPEELGLDKA
ncbi:cytochrome c oxidase subunit 5A, mitochondrial [Corvus moneduloides]|uniref:cytochrome c oxidase subunit 5A, mitochondrial n=1 Tax=Corvus moneduloides TaxID=1196302 RepID=UPI0013628D4F|nr:cytochrome c oxidase subunit 5A, mitochondrial [Corvus moneduloides]